MIMNINSSQSSKESSITIKLPFPPTVNLLDLVSKKSPDGRIPARSPNAFIIYRKVYVETARKSGYFLPMTNISSMASQSWADESEEVRTAYQKIAKDALKVRNDVFPKSSKRKRKDRWNIVSFESPPPASNDIKEQKRANRKAQRQAAKIPARTSSPQNLSNGFSPPSLTLPTDSPSFDMPSTDHALYETFITNANFSVNSTSFLNDHNQSLDVNNVSDNNLNINNNSDNNIPISTFVLSEDIPLQETVQQLNSTPILNSPNSDFNSNVNSNTNISQISMTYPLFYVHPQTF